MAHTLDKYDAVDLTISAAPIDDKEGSQVVKLDAKDILESTLDHLIKLQYSSTSQKNIHFFVDVRKRHKRKA